MSQDVDQCTYPQGEGAVWPGQGWAGDTHPQLSSRRRGWPVICLLRRPGISLKSFGSATTGPSLACHPSTTQHFDSPLGKYRGATLEKHIEGSPTVISTQCCQAKLVQPLWPVLHMAAVAFCQPAQSLLTERFKTTSPEVPAITPPRSKPQ